MTVAVTGSSGLLGAAIVAELLGAGCQVRRLDLADDGSGSTTIVDLRDPAAAQGVLEGCRAVVHAAGIPRPQGWPPAELFATNNMINFNVSAAAVDARVPVVVYISSVSVLGYPFFVQPIRPSSLPVDERQPPAPQDAYALSKYLGEEIWAAAVRRAGHPMLVTNLRMPWIQTPETFRVDIPGATATGDDARNLWAYIDSRDAASAVRLSLEHGSATAGVRTMFVSAADNFAGRLTAALAGEAWPGLDCPIPADGSLVSSERARDTIGYRAEHSWRGYPETL
jgi:nucleoside-diphosphate-sugar epimerase